MIFSSHPLHVAFSLGILAVIVCSCGPADPSSPNTEPPASHLDSLPVSTAPSVEADTASGLVRGQTLYVPAYSHIYVRDAQRTMNLATTLSIRNASPDTPISLSVLEYYDSAGRQVRTYLDTARTLGPLASTYVVVEQDDVRGGVGANFIVRWSASTAVHPPIVESIMITTASTQGISFRSTARVLFETPAQP